MPAEAKFEYISDLINTSPNGADPISEGDDELRGIKSVLTYQFAPLGPGIVSATVANLNQLVNYDAARGTIENRFQGIEDLVEALSIPGAAYDFNDTWWSDQRNVVPERLWFSSGTRSIYSNVPWRWGSNMAPGTESETITCMIDRIQGGTVEAGGDGAVVHRVTYMDPQADYTGTFIRAAPNLSLVLGSPWFLQEAVTIDTAQATSGNILTQANGGIASVCQTINDFPCS